MALNLYAAYSELKTTLISRNIRVLGKRTSVRLEPEMWSSLHDIAKREACAIHDICSLIALRKQEATSLTAAIRVFVMLYFKAASTEQGHVRAGHGNFEQMKKRARVPENASRFFIKKRKYEEKQDKNLEADQIHDADIWQIQKRLQPDRYAENAN